MILNCPKGGKVPIGYCRESCLNYSRKRIKTKRITLIRLQQRFLRKLIFWIMKYQRRLYLLEQMNTCSVSKP